MSGRDELGLKESIRVVLYDEHGNIKQVYDSRQRPWYVKLIIVILVIILIIPVSVYRVFQWIKRKIRGS